MEWSSILFIINSLLEIGAGVYYMFDPKAWNWGKSVPDRETLCTIQKFALAMISLGLVTLLTCSNTNSESGMLAARVFICYHTGHVLHEIFVPGESKLRYKLIMLVHGCMSAAFLYFYYTVIYN